MEWIDNAENALFLGSLRVGKAHLAIVSGRRAITFKHLVLFVNVVSLLTTLEQAYITVFL